MPQIVLSKGKEPVTDTPFEPCAATASHFLFSQGPTVLVLAHDTLALERRFQSHNDNITLISCDNVSERGAGRLVVTYDIGKTAIIWDLFTGEQISRFASYEPLLVAAWMRNGNIAFGMLNEGTWWTFTDVSRKRKRRCHTFRTINKRPYLCTDHLRSDNCIGSLLRL